MNITKQDIISFGKVLTALGHLLKNDPDILLNIIDKEDNFKKDNNLNGINEEKLNDFDLYKLLNNEFNAEETFKKLENYNVEDLKCLLKKYHLGGSKIKSKPDIISHIINYIDKRKRDVFLDYDIEVKKDT